MNDSQFNEFRKELIETIKENRAEIISSVKNTLGLYLKIMIFVFSIFGGVIAWNTTERLTLVRDYQQMRNDFGTFLLTCPPDHQQSQILFDEMLKRYYPNLKRGIDKTQVK